MAGISSGKKLKSNRMPLFVINTDIIVYIVSKWLCRNQSLKSVFQLLFELSETVKRNNN